MSNTAGLTNVQQAIIVFLVAAVAALSGWAAAGFPTSQLAIGAVVAAILLGLGLAIKEIAGGKLTNVQQAIAVFSSAVIAAFAGWATAGFPTSHIAIGALVAALLLGLGLALKEIAGNATTT